MLASTGLKSGYRPGTITSSKPIFAYQGELSNTPSTKSMGYKAERVGSQFLSLRHFVDTNSALVAIYPEKSLGFKGLWRVLVYL